MSADPHALEARYRVRHETTYQYAHTAEHAWQRAHLRPRVTPYQRLLHHALVIVPEPTECRTDQDYFGNSVERFALARAHTALSVHADSIVEVSTHVPAPDAVSPPWEDARDALAKGGAASRFEFAQFVLASPAVPLSKACGQFSATEFTPGRRWLDALSGLARRIHREFEFDPSATTVATPIDEVLRLRRGVCQDFAHLMVACLRAIGLPARYVSGYLLTHPPAGRPRLVGADASHAWVSAWCPGLGWVDADPTNGKLADTEFVTLAWGREYSDVTPLRGVVRGGGEHTLTVAVTVEPLD